MTRIQKIAHDVLLRWPFRNTIRNRLKCPTCWRIGTYKPRGAVMRGRGALAGTIIRRRWLCKWCGLYVSDHPDEPKQTAFIDKTVGAWALMSENPPDVTTIGDDPLTPARLMTETWKIDPWGG